MVFGLGILVAIASLISAAMHLNQDAKNFWDFVAFVCVLGGTLSVAVMTFPWQYRRVIFSSLTSLFRRDRYSDQYVIHECIEFLKNHQSGIHTFSSRANSIATDTLRDGTELHQLGFSKQKVQEILEERIYQSFERQQKVANAIRSLSKYPPAFGLAGTVLGLVTLMRKVSEGADAKQTGFMMAIALMATFYGLLTANLFVNPAGEHIAKTALAERKKAEIALHTVILMMEGASLLEAQEKLNCYVTKENRINVISSITEAA